MPATARPRPALIGGLLAFGLLAFGLLAFGVLAVATAGWRIWPWARSSPAGPQPVSLDRVLTARVELPRLIRDPRTVAVLVRNQGTEPVQVRQVELVSASFAPTGPAITDVVIRAGAAKSLPVIYGEGQCGGELAPSVAPTTARLVVTAAGQEQAVELPIPNADDLAPRLHADCVAQVVTRALDLRLRDWSTRSDGALQATLRVSRVAGDEPISIHGLSGSVLYRLVPVTPLPIELPSGTDSVAITVTAEPARCDAHAMADVKFPYQFRAFVTIGDTPVLPAGITTDIDGQQALPAMWRSLCAH